MDQESLGILQEAIDTRLKGESIDRSIGRTVRRRGLEFSRYVRIMSDLRDYARSRKTSVEEAADVLCKEYEQ